MALLFNIPQHLVLSVLLDWIGSHKDISSLDIACASHQLIGVFNGNGFLWKQYVRHEFFHLLWDPLFVLTDPVLISPQNAVNYIQWLNHRQIRVLRLTVPISKVKEVVAIKALELPRVLSMRFGDQSKKHDIKLADMKTLLSRCPALTSVDCSAWCSMTDDQLAMLAAEPTVRLRVLLLNNCTGITEKGLSIVTAQFQTSLLELSVCCLNITDTALAAVSAHCKHLTKASLSYCQYITSNGILAFGAALPGLLELWLEDLDAPVVNDVMLLQLITTNSRLQVLGLDYCKGITLDCFPKVLAACPSMGLFITKSFQFSVTHPQGCSKCYRTLKLKGCYMRQQCILAMVQACPVLLQALDTKECRKLGSHILRALADKFGSELEVLEVSPWVDVEDDAMVYALAHCPRLQTLSVDFCEALGDDTLAAIALHCPRLTSLSITKCPRVTDAGMAKVLERCHALQVLDLTACALLTDRTLIKIADCCQTCLQLLSILGTGVSVQGILQLMLENKLPQLCKLHVDSKHELWLTQQLSMLRINSFGMKWRKKLVFANYYVE